jgi:beta-galactosidase
MLVVILPFLMFCRGLVEGEEDHGKRPSGSGNTINTGWEFTRVDEMEDALAGRKEIPKKEWKLIAVSSEEEKTEAVKAFDGDDQTFWHTEWIKRKVPLPHEMKIDLGRSYEISALTYLARQDGIENGMIKDFELYASEDTLQWGAPVIVGTFNSGHRMQVANFSQPKSGHYIRLIVKSNHSGNEFASAAEIGLLKKSPRILGKNWTDQFLTESVEKSADTRIADFSLREELNKLTKNKWQKVTLPHTAVVEPLVIANPWEGIAYYRKTFSLDKSLRGKRVTIEFEGAMQLTDVWFNGKHILQQAGGYLPFTIDISGSARYGGNNALFLKVDNRDNPLIPPGKPVRRLDFLYYSGIYRDVRMHVTDPLHITDAVVANIPCGGGIFVTYENVSGLSAQVNIKTHVRNDDSKDRPCTVVQELIDDAQNVVAREESEPLKLHHNADQHIGLALVVKNPRLWHPDHPYLYTLHTVVRDSGHPIDERSTRIGIRSFTVSRSEGLKINGIPFRIRGTNRHMSYPWIGNALSDNASYRDIWLIKNAGMNCVRLAHYPQDPSVLDACDELGLLVLDCIPGWQFFNKTQVFIDRVFRDIRSTIRRDRNHPSVFLWEMSLNEAYPPAEFRCTQAKVAKEEFIGENFLTSGDSYFTKACWDVPYDDWDEETKGRDNNTYPDRPFLIREYGDYEFGGGSSTTRHLRGDGEEGLLQQAWNLQWSHNKNRLLYPRCIGDLNWAMFDGVAGIMNGIEGWGPADLLRLPKFSYYFFQSQRDPGMRQPFDVEQGPMVRIANYWMKGAPVRRVVVYNNCDEVELLVNGKRVARQKPDSGPDTPYGVDYDKGGTPFDGGNCRNIEHAPCTFDKVAYEPGELKAIGYLEGKEVAVDSIFSPGDPAQLKIVVATGPKPFSADGADVVFVRAYVLDAQEHPVPDARNTVTFKLEGNARFISPSIVDAEAGIATILIQSTTKAGEAIITAAADKLLTAKEIIFSQ